MLNNVLVNPWETVTHLVGRERNEIDHHDLARALGDVAAVPIGQDVIFEPRR